MVPNEQCSQFKFIFVMLDNDINRNCFVTLDEISGLDLVSF